jgi:phage terminase large subunit-like protein
MTPVDRAQRYISQVLNGEVAACKWVRLACQRQLNDLANRELGFSFDVNRANRPVQFAESLPHIKGSQYAGKKLAFGDWQCFIITTVFGWVDPQGHRRYRTAYIEVPRKNGKSTMSAPIGLYLLAADNEAGAEVYSAATTRDQARIVWEDAKRMTDRSPGLKSALDIETSAHSIYNKVQASSFKALSKDNNGNLDGLNVHGAIIDELHGHPNRALWDVIETATGSRAQSLIWAITTAGSNRAGICYEQQMYVRKLLENVHTDPTYFGIIYSIDEGDDPFDPLTWAKANPNYGVSVSPDDLARKASKAQQMAAAQNNFLTKHLNVWVNADTSWMNMQAWDKCADPTLDESEFEGMDCVLSCDLATKIDVAAKIRMFWKDIEGHRHYYAFGKYYLPEEAADDGRNSYYSGWAVEGRMVLTQGNVTDYGVIEDHIREDARRFNVLNAGFDPWQASAIIQRLQQDGLPVVEFRQTVQNMSEPMKELEALVLQGRFHFDGDPVLTWMISNVVCHVDAKENIYPRKERSENKIDGAVALISALGMALSNVDDQSSFNDFISRPIGT